MQQKKHQKPRRFIYTEWPSNVCIVKKTIHEVKDVQGGGEEAHT